MKTILGKVRRLVLGVIVIGVLGCSVPMANAAGMWVTLEAIHQIENPRNLSRPGARGELGPYQFRAETWRMHTAVPFARAVERADSDAVAAKHYEWLRRGLERARMPVTPYNIALAWNSGLTAAVQGRAPVAAHHYAQRAENLVGAFSADDRVARR